MRDYTIHFQDGTSQQYQCAEKADLIKDLFDGNQALFQQKVTMLTWQVQGIHYTENVKNGKVDGQLTSADANPYGWRK